MARLRSAPSTQTSGPTTQPTRQALKEKTNTVRSKAKIIPVDDKDKDAFVKDARPKRGRAKKAAPNEDELVMAGGLGPASTQESDIHLSEPPMTTDDLAKSDGPPPPTAKANRRPARTIKKAVQNEAQSKVIDDMKKRMQATARKPAADEADTIVVASGTSGPSSDSLPTKPPVARKSTNSAAERSEFSLSPSPPPPGKLSSAKNNRSSLVQPGSVFRSHGTPTAETSILALKNFKRRPRQPSMLQMVQQRTASARPSAANVQATEDLSVDDLEHVDDGEEFAPEAEGTPLKVTQKPTVPATKTVNTKEKQPAPSTGAARKRRSDEVDLSSSALDGLRAKRQKLIGLDQKGDAGDGLEKRRSVRPSSSARQATPQPLMSPDVQVINSSPSSTPPTDPPSESRYASAAHDEVIPSTEREQENVPHYDEDLIDEDLDQDIPNGTMAEPISSSPLPQGLSATQRTDIMADPLTQVSPPKKRDKPRKKPQPMNTTTLQSLLPKRRKPLQPRNRKSEYDIDSESDGNTPLYVEDVESNEDEPGGRARRQTKTAPRKSKKAPTPKSKARMSRAAAPSTRKSSAPPPRKSTAAPSTARKSRIKPTKTYGRATTSDKENEDDGYESLDENDDSALPDTSISMHDAAQSKELEEAKKKFADVDDWDMEFESMSMEEGRSSSQQWR